MECLRCAKHGVKSGKQKKLILNTHFEFYYLEDALFIYPVVNHQTPWFDGSLISLGNLLSSQRPHNEKVPF